MTWIRSISETEASPELRTLYERMRQSSSSGRVSHLWQAGSLDGKGLERIFDLYRTLMGDPAPLSRAQSEAIAIVVSATSGCGYCVTHHGPKLAAALGDEGLARAIAMDYRTANLPARDRVLLDYAVALTCEPEERTAADLERLREYGFDDPQILKATEIAAFYGMVNRLVLGLGVVHEPSRPAWEYSSPK